MGLARGRPALAVQHGAREFGRRPVQLTPGIQKRQTFEIAERTPRVVGGATWSRQQNGVRPPAHTTYLRTAEEGQGGD